MCQQKAVKQRLTFCAASVQRKKIQGLDKKFRENNLSRFKLLNGEICSDPDVVLEVWLNHFKTLSSSHSAQSLSMAKIQQEYDILYERSFENDESKNLVDTPFTLEETEGVIKSLKSGKAGGLDHLQAEHLKYGGNSLVLWIQQVCNAIVELEAIPNVLKMGVVSPIYKGNGRDPLDTNSYRGITLSPVLSKTLELLLLGCFQAILSAPVFPHQNQTGFVKKTSCTDAIFFSYEILSRLARGGNTAYVCFFDLQKAFDMVQYPLLLKFVFDCGINGKAWRLLNSWYQSVRFYGVPFVSKLLKKRVFNCEVKIYKYL